MSEDIFGCHSGMDDATSVSWVEAKDSVKHAIIHRAPPVTKNFSVPNIKSTEIEKNSVLDKGKT